MGCSQSTPQHVHDGTKEVPIDSKAMSTTVAAAPKLQTISSTAAKNGSLPSRSNGVMDGAGSYTSGTGSMSDPSHSITTTTNVRPRFASYASGASTPDYHSDNDDDDNDSHHSDPGSRRRLTNPKTLSHSTSAIGLDELMEERREMGDLRQNVVHMEVPFGKPIEEVYDGVHSGPVLGSGISGLVRLVTHKATGLRYAVKVLDLGLVDTDEGLKQLREEIFCMINLDHPNVIRLEEVYESHSEIYLVQELCLGGELFDRLDEQPDYHYTEAECARLVKQMLSAVRYLHSKGIIHRDLKLENFLFSDTSTTSELKMIDFGLSKHFHYGEMQHDAVGTPYTVSPEVILGSYDERCDIWAIGVICYLLLSGEPPFGGCGGPEPLMQVRSNILKGAFKFEPRDIWEHVSPLARDFISTLLVTDPKKRPLARDAQTHRWLQEWARRDRKGDDNVLNPNVVKALVNFKEFSDMRKLLCEVLSFTLLPDQIKDLRKEFETLDTDGSGEISLAALKQVLMTNAVAGSLGALTEDEVTDIFDAMRVRKSETRIHWHEFIAAGLSQCQVDDRNLRLAFERLDSDHKGYITLDDILDLMGSDAVQSEDAMRRMWGDSIKAVKCQTARITFDDFLLLMKGQTKESSCLTPMAESLAESKMLMPAMKGPSMQLHVVHEGEPGHEGLLSDGTESPAKSDFPFVTLPSGDTVGSDGLINGDGSNLDPMIPGSPRVSSSSAPTTPAGHKTILDTSGIDSPFSMDEDGDILSSGPGVAGSAASLTPPHSPERGARDYITPMGGRRSQVDLNIDGNDRLVLPGLTGKPPMMYERRRSRSIDANDLEERKDTQDFNGLAHAVRDLLLPESEHLRTQKALNDLVNGKSQTALVVNRKLYRAHRQMRLGVMEASKRFEEQQQRHAHDVLLAQAESESGPQIVQAGLVMRHGYKKIVTSEAIRKLLEQNQAEQQVLVEKATRRGGRGRRSRKKTISDMSGMLSSIGQDEMGAIAVKAAGGDGSPPHLTESRSAEQTAADHLRPPRSPDRERHSVSIPALPDLTATEGHLRDATVPGKFVTTEDPFSRKGRYGHVMANEWDP